MRTPLKILHVGKATRAHILAETIGRSAHPTQNYMLCDASNPGLEASCQEIRIGRCDDPDVVAAYAREVGPDFCIPGPEEPLAAGVVDRLLEIGIPSIGPLQASARIEASKSFTRALLGEFGIQGNPDFRVFDSETGIEAYLEALGDYVVKPDGLTGGKGVRVSGDHLQDVGEALTYCRELLAAGARIVVEEKLIGEEFTLQSFCDGTTLADTIPVQDHKRLLAGDRGPNTGGMGSYSCADHLLPFLSAENLALASRINRSVAQALKVKTGKPYKGILYGSFMLTARGLRVIEYNARFGDPEGMNVLSVLETDLVDICQAIIDGALHQLPVKFASRATVCKYVVPEGYPDKPVKDVAIAAPPVDNRGPTLRMYYGAVREGPGGELLLTGSRALAFVGIGATLAEAEAAAEAGAKGVRGPVFHRGDIGTAALVQSRIDHMDALLSQRGAAVGTRRA